MSSAAGPSNTSGTAEDKVTAPFRKAPENTSASWKPGVSAEVREAERQRRWLKYGFGVDEFEKKTINSREWCELRHAKENLWNSELERLSKAIPEMEAELAKAKQDLVNMDEAEKAFDQEYGAKADQGYVDAVKLQEYRRFLKMDNDDVPAVKIMK